MTSRIPDWQVAAEAADWVTRIDAGPLTADEKAGLAEWLRRSPVHVDELLLSASIMTGLAQVDAGKSRSIEALLAETAPDVIPLFQGGEAAVRPDAAPQAESVDDGHGDDREAGHSGDDAPPGRKIARYWPALAASLVLALAVSWHQWGGAPAGETPAVVSGATVFASNEAEPRSVALDDGSVLYLNANSRVRVAFSDTRRLVELVEGDALFDVARDQARPFRVFAAGTIAEAVGTRFTVERRNGTVTVAVLEGEVLVGPRLDAMTAAHARADGGSIADSAIEGEPIRLAAGHAAQLFENGRKSTAVAVTSQTTAGAWRERQLSFNDEGLSAIAAEFNRFNALKIVVADADLARTRFSGVFDAHDPESFVAFLELSAGVRVDRSGDNQVVLTATGQGS